MNDREKVIKGVQCCLDYFEPQCEKCPYQATEEDKKHVDWDCHKDNLLLDALELLKEHEPVKPIRLENWWKCPSCNGNIVANMNYCPRCGEAVKWE